MGASKYLEAMRYLSSQGTKDQLTEIFFWIKRAPRDAQGHIDQEAMRKKAEAMGLKWMGWKEDIES